MAQSGYSPGIYLKVLRTTTRNFSLDSGCNGRDSNQALLEHKFAALPLYQPGDFILAVIYTHCKYRRCIAKPVTRNRGINNFFLCFIKFIVMKRVSDKGYSS